MKIIDDKNKKLFWYNRNYFFVATILILAVNILLFVILGNNWNTLDTSGYSWSSFSLVRIAQAFLNCYEHANLQHVLLNMVCFFVAGLYLERKTGSIKMLLLIIFLSVFSSCVTTANNLGLGWHGFSGVNYALYGYIILDYVFSFQKSKYNKFNAIFGAIVMALIVLAMCYNGGTDGFSFAYYPYDLINNAGHYTGILAGLFTGFLVQIQYVCLKKELKE